LTPPELRDLLRDALALWGVPARPEVTVDWVTLTAPDGTPLRIWPAAPTEHPVRWWLERGAQRRPCTSVLGLLRSLRNAVGAGEGEARRLRVTP
jgi:hypothetical protein